MVIDKFHINKSYFPLQCQSGVDQRKSLFSLYQCNITNFLGQSLATEYMYGTKLSKTKHVRFADTLDNFKECESHLLGHMDPLVVSSLNWYFDKTLNNYNYFFNITDTEQFYRVTCRTSDFSKHTH